MTMEYTDTLLIAVIVALVELLKHLGVKHKLLPLFSLLFGLIGGVIYLFPEDIKAGILMGIIMGLSAVGLYSGSKNVVEIDDNNEDKESGSQ